MVYCTVLLWYTVQFYCGILYSFTVVYCRVLLWYTVQFYCGILYSFTVGFTEVYVSPTGGCTGEQ